MADIEQLPKLYIRGTIAPRDSFMDMLGGESFSASDVIDFLNSHKEDSEIVVEISSDGGYKSEGIEIYNLLKNSGKKITTLTYKANSIASVIVLSGQTRLIVEHAPFVIHFARIDPINLGLDPLTAEDFQRLADETERADKQILDIYCGELGEEKRTELIAAMADERDLGAKGAIKLGFATGYYKKKKKNLSVEDFHNVCITDHMATIIQNNMAKEKDTSKLEEMILNLGKSISKMFSKIKNEVTLTLADGSQIYVVPANPDAPDDLMNGSAFLLDESGMPTENPAPDGEHTLDDGRVIVVAAGKITEVRDAVDAKKLGEELAAAKTENEKLKAELETVKTENKKAIEDTKAEMKVELEKIQNAFKEFKKQVPGDKTGEDKDKTDVDYSKMSISQRVITLARERRLEQKQSK